MWRVWHICPDNMCKGLPPRPFILQHDLPWLTVGSNREQAPPHLGNSHWACISTEGSCLYVLPTLEISVPLNKCHLCGSLHHFKCFIVLLSLFSPVLLQFATLYASCRFCFQVFSITIEDEISIYFCFFLSFCFQNWEGECSLCELTPAGLYNPLNSFISIYLFYVSFLFLF